ncbi:MAG: alpha/beta hydrolase-fold protein [Pseudomonadota bacterium]
MNRAAGKISAVSDAPGMAGGGLNVDDFLAAGQLDPGSIETFLAGATFPQIVPGGATFAWYGTAESVELLRWIDAGVNRSAFERVPGSDLWLLTLPVHDGGRFEYKLAVNQEGSERWVVDPLNPIRAGDPFGENSVCRTWGYAPPDWTIAHGAPAGRTESLEITSEAFGETRKERVYLPAGYDTDAPYKLVIIHDGSDFDTYADLTVSLDNLIDRGDIPPIVAVLIQTGDRIGEYSRGRRHARYIVNELLPAVTARYPISDHAADRVLLGASLGAVASLVTVFRFPGVFGGLVLNSGTFILDDRKLEQRPNPVFTKIARLVSAMRRAPPIPGLRAFVSTGELEGLAGENRELAEFLRSDGVEVLFKSAWDGHHWHNWRNQLRDELMWVLRRPDQKPAEGGDD